MRITNSYFRAPVAPWVNIWHVGFASRKRLDEMEAGHPRVLLVFQAMEAGHFTPVFYWYFKQWKQAISPQCFTGISSNGSRPFHPSVLLVFQAMEAGHFTPVFYWYFKQWKQAISPPCFTGISSNGSRPFHPSVLLVFQAKLHLRLFP